MFRSERLNVTVGYARTAGDVVVRIYGDRRACRRGV